MYYVFFLCVCLCCEYVLFVCMVLKKVYNIWFGWICFLLMMGCVFWMGCVCVDNVMSDLWVIWLCVFVLFVMMWGWCVVCCVVCWCVSVGSYWLVGWLVIRYFRCEVWFLSWRVFFFLVRRVLVALYEWY